jgi:hypothetical protein
MDRVDAITDYIYLGGIAGVKKDFLKKGGINLIINGKRIFKINLHCVSVVFQ